jgi:hypothetical protein
MTKQEPYYGYAEGMKDESFFRKYEKQFAKVDKYPAFANWLVKSKEVGSRLKKS